DGSMELRCLMSARSPGQTFDLRCEVREKLIDFLQWEHPEALPRSRQMSFRGNVDSEAAAAPEETTRKRVRPA
ncbi:MAG TPA: mechanosensitive ion channel family protein, partial [Pseudolabrys sp.]|nr:mechanosensitive ion channel family protein [Pseudolabrys sp.]